jgi:hypothetical protein
MTGMIPTPSGDLLPQGRLQCRSARSIRATPVRVLHRLRSAVMVSEISVATQTILASHRLSLYLQPVATQMRNRPSRPLNVNTVFSLRLLVPRYLVSWTDLRRAFTAYHPCAPFPAGGALFPVHTRRTPKSRAEMTAPEVPSRTPPASRTCLVEHLPNTLHLITFGTTLFVADDMTSVQVQGVRITSSTHLSQTSLPAFHTR